MPTRTIPTCMITTNHTQQIPPRPKATLFCDECGHESHVTGDWVVHESAHGADFVCPECGATIISRGVSGPPPGERRCQCD